MHPFDSILNAMRVESSLYVRLRARAPWGIAFDSGYQARLLIVESGACVFTASDQAPVILAAGDCLVIKQGVRCAIADQSGRDLTPCSRVTDRVTGEAVLFGGEGAACEFISARLSFEDVAGEPLLALLPDVACVTLNDAESTRVFATLGQIGSEEADRGMGADFVIARLIDVLFIQVIRAWSTFQEDIPPGWLAGMRHRRLAPVLNLVHDNLAYPWTVDILARKAAMSRSTFAELFKSVVGLPPLTYVAGWRIYRAKMLLAGGRAITEVAGLTGYGSDIAFSRAFKSATGLTPGQWRGRHRRNTVGEMSLLGAGSGTSPFQSADNDRWPS